MRAIRTALAALSWAALVSTASAQIPTGPVRSVTGTAGQVNASTTNGAVTLTLPSTITQPENFTGSPFQVNGNTVSLGGPLTTSAGLTTTGTGALTLAGPTTSATYTLPISPATLAGLGITQTWTAPQTFTNTELSILGTSTGKTTFNSTNSGSSNFTVTLPAANDTIDLIGQAQTLSNKTLTSPIINGGTFGPSNPWTVTAGTPTVYLGLNASNDLVSGTPAGGSSATTNRITTTPNTLSSITSGFTTELWVSSTASNKTDNVPGCVSGLNNDFLIESDAQGTSGTYPITVTPASGTIGPNGATSYAVAANYSSVVFQCDGTGTHWNLVAVNFSGTSTRYNTTTSITIGANDNGNAISESNAGAVAATIAQAGTSGFPEGSYSVFLQNTGAGAITVTPTTSTINGVSTMVIPAGSTSSPTGAWIFSDLAGNYVGLPFGSGSGAGLVGSAAGTLMVSPGTTGTVTGLAETNNDCALGVSGAWATSALCLLTTGGQTVSGTDVFSGTLNVSGTFQSGGNTMTFPTSAATLAGLGIDQSFTAGQAVTPSALTMSASTVATNAALSNVFTGTMVHAQSPYTISNPTNLLAGQPITYRLTESSTGGDKVGTWGSDFNFPGGTPVFNTAANAVNVVSCIVDTGTPTLQCFGGALVLGTASFCSSGATPAACGSAQAGSVAVPAGVAQTLVVDTTAVTSNSQIVLTPDESATIAGTTCNTTASTLLAPIVTARTPGTSFTVEEPGTTSVNPACVDYVVVN